MYLLEGMGGWVVYLVGRSLFLLTLGKKGTALCMFIESSMCSLRHEDRTHPYKSGWRKSETRKKWSGIAAETVCVHSAGKGNDTDTVSKEGHRVDHKSQTFSICFIRLC